MRFTDWKPVRLPGNLPAAENTADGDAHTPEYGRAGSRYTFRCRKYYNVGRWVGWLKPACPDAQYRITMTCGMYMVGDLYMNFSFLGVIILMFLLGMLVARVEIPNSKYQLYTYMALFANCIYLVRADIFSWLTFFVFFLIFDWLLRIHIVYDEDITD